MSVQHTIRIVSGALAVWLVPASPRLLSAQSSGAPPEHPTLDDVFKVAAISNVAMSPDGESVLYTVRTTDLEKNTGNADIWLLTLPERGRPAHLQLTFNPKTDTLPQWRPDGTAFAFLSVRAADAEPAKRALYLMPASGGEARMLYEHQTGIRTFDWSPEGNTIAFIAQDPDPPDDKQRTERGRDVAIDGEPGAFSHLWLLDVATRTARRVTAGTAYSVNALAWSPSGHLLAFSATPTPRITDSWKSDVYLVAPDSGATARRLTDNPGPDTDPQFSPDGAAVYYHAVPGAAYRVGYSRVYRVPAAGGTPEDVSPHLDVEPSEFTFTPDGKAVYFQAVTGTTRGVFYMPLGTRQALRLTGEQGTTSQLSFSAARKRVAYVAESAVRPPEVYAALVPPKLSEGALKNVNPLTRHNEQAVGWAVGLSDVVRWKSVDGRQVEGILVYPAGWTPSRGRVPLVVKIHGGPSGVYLQNFQASSYGSDAQRYAADGYAVLLPNPRGSSGYGDAGQQAVVKDWGGLDFQDIMTGVDTLIARGIAHPDSLGVMGWSYGGYMTAWTISQTQRFKAAVVGAGITETIAMWGTQDIVDVFEAYFGGGPWETGGWDVYQKSSPLAHMRNARTPTLIIHGRNDPRVPPNQAQILYRTLRALDVPTELLWLPRTGHGPTEPGLQYETAKAQKEWMDRWIRGKVGKPAAN